MNDENELGSLFPVQNLFIRQQQESEIMRDAIHRAGDAQKAAFGFPLYVVRWMKFFPKRIVM